MNEKRASDNTDEVLSPMRRFDDLDLKLDEFSRFEAIRHLGLNNKTPDTEYDRLTRLASRFLEAPVACFGVVDEGKVIFKSAVGLNGPISLSRELTLDSGLCRGLFLQPEAVVLPDQNGPECECQATLLNALGVKSYLGIPIATPDGLVVGAFSVSDTVVRNWTADEVKLLSELAQLVTHEIENHANRLEVETNLLATRNQLQNVLSVADCLVWEAEVNFDGEHWKWTFNIQPSGLFMRLFGELVPPSNVGLWYRFNIPQQEEMNRRCRESILGGKDGYWQEFQIHSETEDYWLKENVTIRKIGDGLFWLVGVVIDITALKAMEQSLAIALDKALQSSKLKSEFLANMSHEIRTPMNGILGMAHLLEEENLEPSHRDMNRLILKSAEALSSIIDDILDFSKIEAGKLGIEKTDMDLISVAKDVVELLDLNARKKGISLRYFWDRQIPTRTKGDPVRIRQVLLNLLGNAVKFTEKGWVELSVGCVDLKPKSVKIRISVTDTGVGIDPEAMDRLFQPFVQADGSHTRKYGGTGLGLVITKQLVELMNGTMGCNSEFGKGSEFWVELEFEIDPNAPFHTHLSGSSAEVESSPVDQTAPFALEAHSGMPENLTSPKVPVKKKILVVDDNPTNQLVCRMMLEQIGIDVGVAHGGLDAIEKMRNHQYDGILMDCQMPVLDGYELTRRIRNGEIAVVQRDIPIIALTAHAMNGDRELCLECGMDHYVSKPARKQKIQEALEKVGIIR